MRTSSDRHVMAVGSGAVSSPVPVLAGQLSIGERTEELERTVDLQGDQKFYLGTRCAG